MAALDLLERSDPKLLMIAHHAIIYMGHHFHIVPELIEGWEAFDGIPTNRGG